MNRTVTMTDAEGRDLGQVDILKAHTGAGTLHKAFSVFVFNPDRTKTMIQKRSDKKMLWAGSWANTCCSHPFERETPVAAGQRRLMEELGFSCDLEEGPLFTYRAEDPRGKGVEHEYDQILVGVREESAPVKPNPDEVSEWRWIAVDELVADVRKNPTKYTAWLPIALPKVLAA